MLYECYEKETGSIKAWISKVLTFTEQSQQNEMLKEQDFTEYQEVNTDN